MDMTPFNPQTEPFGTMGAEIKRDVHYKDLDAKIIITSHNSRPGLGKTTLAIRMARNFDRHGWDANSKAFMEASAYHNAYSDKPSGSVLLFDEIEGEADSRRSVSKKNVGLSQAWAQNRYRNMITICTLPTVSMLDKRLLEMSDYWINVMGRGIAHPYRIKVNDFNGKVYRERIDENGTIRFGDLPDNDPDYEWLRQKKDERREIQSEYYTPKEHKKELDKAVKNAKKECRDKWIKVLREETDFTQQKISQLSTVDVSRKRVGQIVNGH